MTKRIFSFFLLVIFSILSYGAPVSENTAVLVANQWITGHQEISSLSTISNTAKILKNDKNQAIAWVISINPKGFIIVAADDVISPIVTYGTEGNFTGFDNPNSTLSLLLKKDLTNRIENYAILPDDEKNSISRQWNNFTSGEEQLFTMKALGAMNENVAYAVVPTVDYFIKDTWNQTNWNNTNPTYQKFTPNNYVTGCVPTAMSMVMHYYAFPSSATGTNAVKIDGIDTVKSFDSQYDFTKMPTSINVNSSVESIDQIARLMSDSGIGCKAIYTSQETGAYMSNAATSLKSNFKYKSATCLDLMFMQDYNPIIQSELNNKYPVMLAIVGSSGGHAVICDGWGKDDSDGTTRYHINMGWGGTDNNWYNLPNIKTYNSVSEIIYNIRRPDQTVIVPEKIKLLLPANQSVVPNASVLLRWNSDTEAVKYEYQVADNQNFTTTIAAGNATIVMQSINYSFIPDTTYYWRIRGVSTDDANGEWSDIWSFTIEKTPLSPPQLVSPANNAINIPANTTLTWGTSANANSYDIEIDTTNNFTNPTTYNNTGVSQVVALNDSTVYFWRVRAKENANNVSTWSTVFTFTTADPVVQLIPPVLISPANNAIDISKNSSLVWGASANANSYDAEIDTNINFTNPTTYNCTITSQNVALNDSTTYYWRIRSKENANNVSAWSTVFTFKTADPVIQLTAPTLLTPSNNSVNIAVNTTLVWTVSSGAVSYDTEIDTNANFTNPVVYNNTAVSQSVNLNPGTTYFWRVRAKVDVANVSAWSSPFTFTTSSPVVQLLPPALISPADNAVNVAVSTTLIWGPSANASGYDVEISVSSNFNTPLTYSSTSTSQAVNLIAGTTYYWHVRSTSAVSNSAWSTARSFTTALPVIQLLPPTLITPVNNAINIPVSTTLTWSAAANATGYTIELASTSNFTNPITYTSTQTSYTVVLTSGTLYYWRVRSSNANNNSVWSNANSFTTANAVIQLLPPVLSSPANASTNIPVSTALTWSSAINATGYDIEIATNSSFNNPISYNASTLSQAVSLTNGVTYYWHVRSRDNNNNISAWSTARSFTTVVSNINYTQNADLYISESKINGKNIGYGIYDTTGLTQNLRIAQTINRQTIYVITIKNNSQIPDSYQIRSDSVFNSKWIVKLLDTSNRDITRQYFSTNGFLTPTIPVNGTYKILLSVSSRSGQDFSQPVSITIKTDAKSWKDLSAKKSTIAADSVIATVDLSERPRNK